MILSLMAGISMTSINGPPSISSWDDKQFGFCHITWWCGLHVQLVNDDEMFFVDLLGLIRL